MSVKPIFVISGSPCVPRAHTAEIPACKVIKRPCFAAALHIMKLRWAGKLAWHQCWHPNELFFLYCTVNSFKLEIIMKKTILTLFRAHKAHFQLSMVVLQSVFLALWVSFNITDVKTPLSIKDDLYNLLILFIERFICLSVPGKNTRMKTVLKYL